LYTGVFSASSFSPFLGVNFHGTNTSCCPGSKLRLLNLVCSKAHTNTNTFPPGLTILNKSLIACNLLSGLAKW
jgi:hypothetical protein